MDKKNNRTAVCSAGEVVRSFSVESLRNPQLLGKASLSVTALLIATAASAQTTLPPVLVEPQKKAATKSSAPSKSKSKAQAKAKASPAPAPAPVVAQPIFGESTGPADGLSSNATPASGNTLQAGSGMGRRPGEVQDTPQIVNVVPKEVMQERNTQTLDQVLRTVPGVTLAIGEGGPPNGDQYRIRGVQSKGDIYSDGLRDFGMYTRDSFNYESVQVLKGPSSETFGMGTGGGAINTQSKLARLESFTNADVTYGSGPYKRATIDTNQRIGETSAIRLNGMYTDQEHPDRDLVGSERWGFAADAGFGIKTDTEFHLSYLHQQDDRVPDYGVPLLSVPGTTITRPITEHGSPRSAFYGFDNDKDDTRLDTVTARLKHKFSDQLTLHSDTRYTSYERSFIATKPNGCATNDNCAVNFLAGNPAAVRFSGPGAYDLDGWAFQNVTSLLARFSTGIFRHELVAGVDYFTESNDRLAYTTNRPTGAASAKDIFNPPHSSVGQTFTPGTSRTGESENLGFFLSDRVWLTQQFSVMGSVRWDQFKAETSNAGVHTETDSSMVSPKVSLIWEPSTAQTYYASWGRAYSPQGYYITGETVPAASADMDPEETETYELGAKWNFFGGRLGLSGAVFQVNKDNSVLVDPNTGAPTLDGRERGERYRIRGVEVGLSGQVAPLWKVWAGYTYLDAKIQNNGVTGVNAGNRMWLVPEHSGSLWVTHDATRWLPLALAQGKLTLGTGVTYSSDVYLNAANTAWAPANFSWDGLVSYETKSWRMSLNAYNLTDELNYDQLWTDRVVPSAGRTLMLTTGVKF